MKASDFFALPKRPRTLSSPKSWGEYAALLSRVFVPCLFFDIMMYADRSVLRVNALHLGLLALWFLLLPGGVLLWRRFGQNSWPGALSWPLTAGFLIFCVLLYEAGLYSRLRRIVLFQAPAALCSAALAALYLLLQLLWGRRACASGTCPSARK